MRLVEVSFRNFKVLDDKKFIFNENPYFWSAPNESGKTSLIEGIRAIFKLSPESLVSCTTKGKEHPPVIELKFSLENKTYTLKLNAQDGTVSLRGEDGLDLSKKEKILEFLEKKGYRYFPKVVEHLLILKERDLSVSTEKGLKELINSFFKTGNIERTKQTVESFLRKRGGNYFKDLLGNIENDIREKYEKIEKRYREIKALREDYQRNLEQLEKLRKELEEAKDKENILLEEIQRNEAKRDLAAYFKLKKEINKLKEDIKNLEKEIKQKENELENLEKRKDHLNKEELKLHKELESSSKIITNISSKEKELEKIKKEIKILKKIESIEKDLKGFVKEDLNKLRKELILWKNFEEMCKENKGLIKVLNIGKDSLKINGKVSFEDQIDFQGIATIEYQDLKLEVYSNLRISEQKEKIKEFERKYSSQEDLENIIELLEERDKEKAKLEKGLTLEEAIKKKEEIEGELKKLLEEKDKLSKKEKRLEKIKKDKEEIQKQKSSLEKEKIKKEMEKANLEEKLKKKEIEVYKGKDLQKGLSIEDIEEVLSLSVEELDELINTLKEEIKEKEKKLEDERKKVNELDREIARLEGQTKNAPREKEFEEILQEKREFEVKLRQLERVRLVLIHSREILKALEKEINSRYLEHFEKKTAEIFRHITGGKYITVDFKGHSLFFSEEDFKNQWTVTDQDGREFSIGDLSDGTSAQLLLSARLALIEMFCDRPAFLLFDEPFAYFDSVRKERSIEILRDLSDNNWQTIVLSAE